MFELTRKIFEGNVPVSSLVDQLEERKDRLLKNSTFFGVPTDPGVPKPDSKIPETEEEKKYNVALRLQLTAKLTEDVIKSYEEEHFLGESKSDLNPRAIERHYFLSERERPLLCIIALFNASSDELKDWLKDNLIAHGLEENIVKAFTDLETRDISKVPGTTTADKRQHADLIVQEQAVLMEILFLIHYTNPNIPSIETINRVITFSKKSAFGLPLSIRHAFLSRAGQLAVEKIGWWQYLTIVRLLRFDKLSMVLQLIRGPLENDTYMVEDNNDEAVKRWRKCMQTNLAVNSAKHVLELGKEADQSIDRNGKTPIVWSPFNLALSVYQALCLKCLYHANPSKPQVLLKSLIKVEDDPYPMSLEKLSRVLDDCLPEASHVTAQDLIAMAGAHRSAELKFSDFMRSFDFSLEDNATAVVVAIKGALDPKNCKSPLFSRQLEYALRSNAPEILRSMAKAFLWPHSESQPENSQYSRLAAQQVLFELVSTVLEADEVDEPAHITMLLDIWKEAVRNNTTLCRHIWEKDKSFYNRASPLISFVYEFPSNTEMVPLLTATCITKTADQVLEFFEHLTVCSFPKHALLVCSDRSESEDSYIINKGGFLRGVPVVPGLRGQEVLNSYVTFQYSNNDYYSGWSWALHWIIKATESLNSDASFELFETACQCVALFQVVTSIQSDDELESSAPFMTLEKLFDKSKFRTFEGTCLIRNIYDLVTTALNLLRRGFGTLSKGLISKIPTGELQALLYNTFSIFTEAMNTWPAAFQRFFIEIEKTQNSLMTIIEDAILLDMSNGEFKTTIQAIQLLGSIFCRRWCWLQEPGAFEALDNPQYLKSLIRLFLKLPSLQNCPEKTQCQLRRRLYEVFKFILNEPQLPRSAMVTGLSNVRPSMKKLLLTELRDNKAMQLAALYPMLNAYSQSIPRLRSCNRLVELIELEELVVRSYGFWSRASQIAKVIFSAESGNVLSLLDVIPKQNHCERGTNIPQIAVEYLTLNPKLHYSAMCMMTTFAKSDFDIATLLGPQKVLLLTEYLINLFSKTVLTNKNMPLMCESLRFLTLTFQQQPRLREGFVRDEKKSVVPAILDLCQNSEQLMLDMPQVASCLWETVDVFLNTDTETGNGAVWKALNETSYIWKELAHTLQFDAYDLGNFYIGQWVKVNVKNKFGDEKVMRTCKAVIKDRIGAKYKVKFDDENFIHEGEWPKDRISYIDSGNGFSLSNSDTQIICHRLEAQAHVFSTFNSQMKIVVPGISLDNNEHVNRKNAMESSLTSQILPNLEKFGKDLLKSSYDPELEVKRRLWIEQADFHWPNSSFILQKSNFGSNYMYDIDLVVSQALTSLSVVKQDGWKASSKIQRLFQKTNRNLSICDAEGFVQSCYLDLLKTISQYRPDLFEPEILSSLIRQLSKAVELLSAKVLDGDVSGPFALLCSRIADCILDLSVTAGKRERVHIEKFLSHDIKFGGKKSEPLECSVVEAICYCLSMLRNYVFNTGFDDVVIFDPEMLLTHLDEDFHGARPPIGCLSILGRYFHSQLDRQKAEQAHDHQGDDDFFGGSKENGGVFGGGLNSTNVKDSETSAMNGADDKKAGLEELVGLYDELSCALYPHSIALLSRTTKNSSSNRVARRKRTWMHFSKTMNYGTKPAKQLNHKMSMDIDEPPNAKQKINSGEAKRLWKSALMMAPVSENNLISDDNPREFIRSALSSSLVLLSRIKASASFSNLSHSKGDKDMSNNYQRFLKASLKVLKVVACALKTPELTDLSIALLPMLLDVPQDYVKQFLAPVKNGIVSFCLALFSSATADPKLQELNPNRNKDTKLRNSTSAKRITNILLFLKAIAFMGPLGAEIIQKEGATEYVMGCGPLQSQEMSRPYLDHEGHITNELALAWRAAIEFITALIASVDHKTDPTSCSKTDVLGTGVQFLTTFSYRLAGLCNRIATPLAPLQRLDVEEFCSVMSFCIEFGKHLPAMMHLPQVLEGHWRIVEAAIAALYRLIFLIREPKMLRNYQIPNLRRKRKSTAEKQDILGVVGRGNRTSKDSQDDATSEKSKLEETETSSNEIRQEWMVKSKHTFQFIVDGCAFLVFQTLNNLEDRPHEVNADLEKLLSFSSIKLGAFSPKTFGPLVI